MADANSAFTIRAGALSAQIVPYGASLASLHHKSRPHNLVLGFPDTETYLTDPHLMGAVVGRYANRIADGLATIAGREIRLERNENGNHLHGAAGNFARRFWRVEDHQPERIDLSISSPDGESGYPGNLEARAIYQILPEDTLRLTVEARSDADTIVNMCHHPYFTLDGADTISDHSLEIFADHYLPSDDDLIPTGEIAPVDGTHHDFSVARRVADTRHNNTYCVHCQPVGPLKPVARLKVGGFGMEVSSTQPGLHLYDGYKLRADMTGHDGRRYGPRAGLCLEAQNWPNSPNSPGFPSSFLQAGETYRQIVEYRFVTT